MKITQNFVKSSDLNDLSVYKYDQDFARQNLTPARTVLFSHANGFHGRCFDPTIESLVENYQCVSFDLRGHGDSKISPDWQVEWRGYGDDALAVAKTLPENKIAVGHSMGGAALVMAALARPDLFQALILYEPIIFPSHIRDTIQKSSERTDTKGAPSNSMADGARRRRNSFASRNEAFANYASKPPMNAFDERSLHAFVDHGFYDTEGIIKLKCAPEHEARNFEMGAIHDTFDRLKNLSVKTWIVTGAQQANQPSGFAVNIAEQIPNSVLTVWQDLGHFGPMQNPERLARLIREVDELTSANT